MGLTNRELAAVVVLAAVFVPLLLRRDVREAFKPLVRQLASPALSIPLLLLFAYVSGLTWVGARVGLWNPGLLKETVLWLFTVGFVAFLNLNKVIGERRYLWRVLLQTVEIVAVLEFVGGLFAFRLWVEILLQAVLLFLVLVAAAASLNKEHRGFATVANTVIGLAGLSFVAYSIHQLVTRWGELDRSSLVLEGVLPVWMTVGFLPFIYLFGTYAAYERPIRQIASVEGASRLARLRAAVGLALTFRGRRDRFRGFGPFEVKRMVEADSVAGARGVAQDFLARVRARELAEAEEKQRLIDFANVDGVGAEGRRLDRREFEETTKALSWLGTCQMGQYRNRGEYRRDMLEILSVGSGFADLPEEPGIEMDVSAHGQRWWAWRRTVTGWCFAIGAASAPPDLWHYDGPEPPNGPPAEDPLWGHDRWSSDHARNWW